MYYYVREMEALAVKRGKTINVFLIDGEANGKIRAQITNWNGVAYKIPRELLDECKTFEAFQQSGVYFLFGYRNVYVGQAEVRKTGKGIYQRILDHETDKLKNDWEEVVIFTTKDNSFGRTDISYLENRFYNKALAAGRYNVRNNNEPTIGTVTEEKENELEEFIDQAELVLGALGYKVFEKAEPSNSLKKTVTSEESKKTVAPPLQDPGEMKIGEYVYSTMSRLSESGYTFSSEEIDKMCTAEWSKEVFGTKNAFMKRYVPGKTDNKDPDGKYVRFRAEPFVFGSIQVLISKEWYPRQLERFKQWYETL